MSNEEKCIPHGFTNCCNIVEVPLDRHECLDFGPGCGGKVEYRMALSMTGMSFARCDAHWEKRLDTQAGINRRYPDSPMPPADFDPYYAGERWDYDY